MNTGRKPWTYGFILGLGYFGITAVSPIYNTFLPLLLAEGRNIFRPDLSATLVGFVMTWDNWLNMFVPAWAGAASDRSWTRWGRRKPWILSGAPFAVLGFALIPEVQAIAALLALVLVANLALALIRAPGLALLGDLFLPAERSKANGVINLLGGLGAVAALAGSSRLAMLGPAAPFRLGGALLLGSVFVFALLVHERREWRAEASAGMGGVWSRLADMVRHRERRSLWFLAALFFSFSGFNIVETWVSSFGRFALGLSAERVPYILAVFAGALLVGAIPSGFMGARVGHRRTMGLGVAMLTGLFLFGIWVRSAGLLMLMLVPAGLAWAMIIINLFPLLFEVGGEGSLGLFTGLYYTVTSLAAVIGPQTAGILLDVSGQNYGWMWALAAGLMAAAGGSLLMVADRSTSPDL